MVELWQKETKEDISQLFFGGEGYKHQNLYFFLLYSEAFLGGRTKSLIDVV